MRKVLTIAGLLLCFSVADTRSEDEFGTFYEDVMISNDMKRNEGSERAKNKASRLLDTRPSLIKIEGAPPAFHPRQGQTPPAHQPEITATKYGEAPFGLSWGAAYNQTLALGVAMERVERKDSPNSFAITKLPKPLPDFREVIIGFGEDNLLWRLSAYGNFLEDDEQATKALRLYRQYYKLLSQKYGRAKQFYTPKISKIEKPYKDEYGVDQIEIIEREEPIGGENFREELKSGDANLYATFEDNDVGAVLALMVNGDNKTYIIIDYTNLRIFREREEKTFNAL